MDKDSKDLNDMQEQLAMQMGKKPKNSWVARSVEIDDVDIKVLWTAPRQKTYQAKALMSGGAIQCVAVTQHRHHILLFILSVNISLSDSVDTRWIVCSYHFWSQYTFPRSDPILLCILSQHQGYINRCILLTGLWARRVSCENVENMELRVLWFSEHRALCLRAPCSVSQSTVLCVTKHCALGLRALCSGS